MLQKASTNFNEKELACVGHLPLWDILRCITLLGELVVDKSQFAALLTIGVTIMFTVMFMIMFMIS